MRLDFAGGSAPGPARARHAEAGDGAMSEIIPGIVRVVTRYEADIYIPLSHTQTHTHTYTHRYYIYIYMYLYIYIFI